MPNAKDGLDRSNPESGAALLILVALLAVIAALAIGQSYFGGKSRQLDLTQESGAQLERIRKALNAFVIVNNRLPCAADATKGDWREDCATPFANAVVPWKTLGLQESSAVDGWGHLVAYHPSALLTTGTPYQSSPPSDGLEVFTAYDAGGNPSGAANAAAYVLVGAGPNGAGGWMMSGKRRPLPTAPAAEAENSDGDSQFIKTSLDAGATFFDDLVAFDSSANICSATRLCQSAQQTESFFSAKDNPDSFVSSNGQYGRLVRASNGKEPKAGQDNVIHFSENPDAKDGKSLDETPTHKAVCVWFHQKLDFQNQSLRAYFTFNWWPGEESNTQFGFADGFTLAVVPWGTPTGSCGYDGSSLGYKDLSLKTVNRMAVEFDIYQYSNANWPSPYDQTTHDPDRNHVSVLFNNSIDHQGTPGGAGGWAASCAANSSNGSAGGCTYQTGGGLYRAWMEEKSRLEKKLVPYAVRLELQRGCDSTCSSCARGGNYLQVRGWIDCTDKACPTISGESPRSKLDAATARTLNYCVQQPANWGAEMNEVMLGFTYATGGATSALSIREINLGNGLIE